jgi:hypothetical protein
MANTKKIIGVSAYDPDSVVVEDRFGKQSLAPSAGDTIKQELKDLTTEEVNKLDSYKNTLTEIDAVKDAYNEIFTGPVQANWNQAKSWVMNTPEYQKLKTRGDKLRSIVYGLSGKAINETELAWLNRILPKLAQPDENYLTNVRELEQWIKDRQANYRVSLRDARRNIGRGVPTPQSPTPTPNISAKEYEDLYSKAIEAKGVDATDKELDAWVDAHRGGSL